MFIEGDLVVYNEKVAIILRYIYGSSSVDGRDIRMYDILTEDGRVVPAIQKRLKKYKLCAKGG